MRKVIRGIALCASLVVLAFAGRAEAQFSASFSANTSFSPGVVLATQTSRLRIEFLNNEPAPVTALALSNSLPAGMFVRAAPNVSSTCGGSFVPANGATNGSYALTGGTIPARVGLNAGTCAVEFDVFTAYRGSFNHVIAANAASGEILYDAGGGNMQTATIRNGASAQATLAATLLDLTGSIATVGTDAWIQGGETWERRITLTNPNAVPVTGVAFTHNLGTDGGWNSRAEPGTLSVCGGTVVISDEPSPQPASSGPTSRFVASGLTVPANGSCVIPYQVSPSRSVTLPRSHWGQTQNFHANLVTSNEGARNSHFGSSMHTDTGIQVDHWFNDTNHAIVNATVTSSATYRIQIYHAQAVAVSNFNLTQALPAGLEITGIQSNDCGGTLTTPGNSSISLTGATLPGVNPQQGGHQGRGCDIRVTVMPLSATPQDYWSTLPAGNLAGFAFNAPSNKRLQTINTPDPLRVDLSFAHNNGDHPIVGDNVDLTYTFRNIYHENLRNIVLNHNLVSNFTANAGLRVGGASVVSQTCNAIVNAVPGTTTLSIADVNLGAGQNCTVRVRFAMRANAPGNRWIGTTIPRAQIVFDRATAENQNPLYDSSAQFWVFEGLRIWPTYSPSTVSPGGESRLTISLERRTNMPSTTSNLAYSYTLPTGHTIAPVPAVVNECGGTVTATPGSGTIALSGGSLAVPSTNNRITCNLTFSVRTPATTGQDFFRTNGSQVTGIAGGHPAGENAISGVDHNHHAWLYRTPSFLTINKQFVPTTVKTGQRARVRVILANTRSGSVNLSGVGLTDTLVAPLELAPNPNPTFTTTSGGFNTGGCGTGSFATVPGPGGSITLAGATINAGTTCHVEYDVLAPSGGNVTDGIAVGDVISAQGTTNDATASATLTVEPDLGVTVGFSPQTLAVGETATMTFTILNAQGTGYTGSTGPPALSASLPAALAFVPGSAATSCAGGTASITGGGALELSGGSFAANSTCTVTANVTASATGNHAFSLAASSLATTTGATNQVAPSANLVAVAPPTITASLNPATIAYGATSTVTYTIANPNAAALLPAGITGAGFSASFANMTIASPPGVSTTCTGLAYSASAGGTSFAVSDVRISAGSSCTVSIRVTSTNIGANPISASGVTSHQNATAGPAATPVNLTVNGPVPLTIAKVFDEGEVGALTPTRLQITITNPNAFATSLGSPAFTDLFPTSPGAMTVATTPNIFTNCGGTLEDGSGGTLEAGDTGLRLMGGSVAANGSCLVSLNVQMADAQGTYTNTTSDLAHGFGTTPAASDTIIVNNVLPITSANEAIRNVFAADTGFFVDSLLGPGDTLAGVQARVGAAGQPGRVVVTVDAISPGLTVDPADGVIIVNGQTPPGTYTVSYTICQATNLGNCAPQRLETVVVAARTIVAGTGYTAGAPLARFQTDALQFTGNMIGAQDTLQGVQATLGTAGSVTLSILGVTGPDGQPSDRFTASLVTGIIQINAAPPAGDYTIAYRICETRYMINCANGTETVRIIRKPIAAAAEAARSYDGRDATIAAGNALGAGDTMDGAAATVGAGAAGSVDLALLSFVNGVGADMSGR